MSPSPRVPPSYEIPSAAGGDEGLEGFSVLAGGQRVGRVAALNRTQDALALVVDMGDAYRPVAARSIAEIEMESRRIRLSAAGEEALAVAAAVVPQVRLQDSSVLVRHIPRELDRLLVAGDHVTSRRSDRWYVGGAAVVLGGIGSMAGPMLTAQGVGGTLRWLWVAIPVAVLVLGAALLWRELGSDSPTRLSQRDKAADAASAVFGISPRTRRRG